MNLVTRALALTSRRAWSPQPISNLDAWMDVAALGGVRVGGGYLTPEMALTLVPVYAAVRVLSSAVASCPLITYRGAGPERVEAPNHPLADTLRRLPNPEMTAFEFWEMAMGHLLLWGNFYAELERNPYGVVALWPLRPDRMRLVRNQQDEIVYVYRREDGTHRAFSWQDMLHVRGQAVLDTLCPRSAVAYGAEAIGLGLAAQDFGAKFYTNDSRPGGILTVDGKLTDEAGARLKAAWEQMHAGGQNRWRVAVLENGVTWQAIGVPPEQAQFLQTRQFQRTEIAGLFGVPLHMLGDLSRATWANIEHQSIEFVTHSIEPWTTRIEQAVWRDVFRITTGKRDHSAEFYTDLLRRGDAKSRQESLAIMRQNGVITGNEWRRIEGMNPLPADVGDVALVNGNMIPIEKATAPEPPPAPPAPALPPASEGENDEPTE